MLTTIPKKKWALPSQIMKLAKIGYYTKQTIVIQVILF